MTISSVNLTRALENQAYAQQVIRSGKCSPEQVEMIRNKYDPNDTGLLDKWKSVDSTQYEITDDEKDVARARGSEKVDKATDGFDGEADNTATKANTAATVGSAGATAAASTAAVIAAVAGAERTASQSKASGFLVLASGAALLAQSLILKAINPNKDQAQALDDLAPTMQEAQNELGEQQSVLSETTNDLVESTDELSEASEEANKATETKQKEYEKLQARYQELAAKQEAAKTGGEPLTDAEKAEFIQLSGTLGTAYEDLKNIKVEGDESLEEAKEAVEEKQEVYDDAAMKMEEVQEITDFSAEFDEATKDNAQEVKTCANIGKIASVVTIAAGALHAWKVSSLFGTAEGVAALGGMAAAAGAGLVFNGIAQDQEDYKSRAEAGVENRTATEEVNVNTNDVYEEELDNYSASIDMMGEIEYTETTATETQIVALSDTQPTEDGAEAAPAAAGTGTDTPTVNPFAPPSNDGAGGDGDDNSNPFGGQVDKDKEV